MELSEQIQAVIDILLESGDLSVTIANLYLVKGKVTQFEKELADYKKHFEPQMIQIQLLEKAHAEQALTFRRG